MSVIIDSVCPFDPVDTFECGQCFRWNRADDGVYTGISDGKICRVKGGRLGSRGLIPERT